MDRKESDSPCQELSNAGLESVVTLLVCWQIDYSCASPGKAIQWYVCMYHLVNDAKLCCHVHMIEKKRCPFVNPSPYPPYGHMHGQNLNSCAHESKLYRSFPPDVAVFMTF